MGPFHNASMIMPLGKCRPNGGTPAETGTCPAVQARQCEGPLLAHRCSQAKTFPLHCRISVALQTFERVLNAPSASGATFIVHKSHHSGPCRPMTEPCGFTIAETTCIQNWVREIAKMQGTAVSYPYDPRCALYQQGNVSVTPMGCSVGTCQR